MMHMREDSEKAERFMEGWWILALIALWFVLQMWVLPKLGVKT